MQAEQNMMQESQRQGQQRQAGTHREAENGGSISSSKEQQQARSSRQDPWEWVQGAARPSTRLPCVRVHCALPPPLLASHTHTHSSVPVTHLSAGSCAQQRSVRAMIPSPGPARRGAACPLLSALRLLPLSCAGAGAGAGARMAAGHVGRMPWLITQWPSSGLGTPANGRPPVASSHCRAQARGEGCVCVLGGHARGRPKKTKTNKTNKKKLVSDNSNKLVAHNSKEVCHVGAFTRAVKNLLRHAKPYAKTSTKTHTHTHSPAAPQRRTRHWPCCRCRA